MGARKDDREVFLENLRTSDNVIYDIDNSFVEIEDDIHKITLGTSTHKPVLAPPNWRQAALSIIHRLSQDVIDESHITPALQKIVGELTSSFPITCAAIETYENERVTFSTVSLANTHDHPVVRSITPLNTTLAGEVIRRQSTLILTDGGRNDYCICPSLSHPFSVYHYLGVPLQIDGTVSGVLSLATAHPIVVDKESITWAETIAYHIAALFTREAVTSRIEDPEDSAVDILRALASPTLICNSTGAIEHINAAFHVMAERFNNRAIDTHTMNIFTLFDNDELEVHSTINSWHEALHALFDQQQTKSHCEVQLSQPGFDRWYLATMSLMPDHETAIVMFVDITDQRSR